MNEEDKAYVLNQLGHVYDLMGEKEKANEYFLDSEKQGFELTSNLINRGRYEYSNGNYEGAENYFMKVIEKEELPYIKSEMYYNLSNIYLLQEWTTGFDKTIEYAKKGIEMYQDYAYNYLILGIAYINSTSEDFEKSIKNFDKVLEINPKSSQAYKWKGIYYYTIDDYEKALDCFKKQNELSLEDISLTQIEKKHSEKSSIYDIARTYALLGNLEESINYLKKLLNGKNPEYYYAFVVELGYEDGPFKEYVNENSILLMKFIEETNKLYPKDK